MLPLLALLLLCLVLTGCAEIRVTKPLNSRTLLEINDAVCTTGTGILRLLEAREEYGGSREGLWELQVDGMTMADYVKDAVKDDLQRYTAAQAMASDMTIFITDQEREKAEAEADALMDGLGEKYNLSHYVITRNDAVDLFLKRTYYNKIFDKLSESILMEISEVETKAIEIDYVLIPSDAGVEVAERMRNEIKSGFVFADVCDRYGYKAEQNITLTRGSFPLAFENTAFALRDNEVSEIIETREGFYIIYCLEDYMVAESMANRNRVIADGRQERFDKAYESFASSGKMRFNSGEWDSLDISTMQ